MHDPQVSFTPQDRLILDSYKTMVEGLAAYLGEGYELVLHSLENLEHSAVKVANGHHTGRREGAPITDLALSMLSRLSSQESNGYVCYNAKNKHGAPLRSTTISIQGVEGKVIGLLCINFYLDTPLSQCLAALGLSDQPAPAASPTPLPAETFADNSGELITKAVESARLKVKADRSVRPSLRNREIVALLYSQGIFNMKDAVNLVAEVLAISSNTVYLHLRHVKGQ